MTAPKFRVLSTGLHVTANSAINWFTQKWGIKKTKIAIEESFSVEINLRPTFHCPLSDGHILCVEVSESIYNDTLDSVVLHCREKGLPVKLFVAVPKDVSDSEYSKKLKKAKLAGVGVIEVDHESGEIIQPAISLSLAGVRPIESSAFRPQYREPLQHAHQTFRGGEPSKACSLVYDEIEAACRRLGEKCVIKKLLPAGKINFTTAPWATVLRYVDKHLDRTSDLTTDIDSSLISRIIGITGHRNESGHKPESLKKRIARDRSLRTRFETAVDILQELNDATKKLRI